MNKFICQFLFVYLAALFLMFAMGCGPRLLQANSPQEPEKEISYESEAQSTIVIPKL